MAKTRQAPDVRPAQVAGMGTTTSLLVQIRQGNDDARNRLIERYLPALRRWAHGHVPPRVRGVMETDDIVQVTLMKALDHLKGFVPERKGAFLAYLRRIMQNEIRDELRRLNRRPPPEPLKDIHAGGDPSPLCRAIGAEALAGFNAAMELLNEEQREAVFLRIELGFTHQEVADSIGAPSANAARMLVSRALVRLTELMDVKHDGRTR
jgi:RNA polymerase sigma-70 factor (ECF subfamily)